MNAHTTEPTQPEGVDDTAAARVLHDASEGAEGQEAPLQCSGSEAGPAEGHSANFEAPAESQVPKYDEFARLVLGELKAFAEHFGGTDIGRCHKIEARALKALLPKLQLRLERI